MQTRMKIESDRPDWNPPDLSEQDVVSCSHYGNCSGGGIPFTYLRGGIVNESCFPYTSGDGEAPPCSDKCENGKLYKLKDSGVFNSYGSYPDNLKRGVIEYGPLFTGIPWDSPAGGHAIYLTGWENDKWHFGGHIVDFDELETFWDFHWCEAGYTPDYSINLTSLDGGEQYLSGETKIITWESVDVTGNVEIRLSTDGRNTYPTLIANVSATR